MPTFTTSIKNSIKKIQDDTRKKKADRYGVSLADYDQAVKEAKAKGNKVAYGKFLKDVEKKQYLIQPGKTKKAGDTLSNINRILDSFEGPKGHTGPKRKKKNTPIKKGTKYNVSGGRVKTRKTNKGKKRKQQRKDDWLGDLGMNF